MWQERLEIATRLARTAGDILMSIYDTDFSVEMKGESDPVTLADKKANAYLVGELRKLLPGDGVVAEESPDLSDAIGKKLCWYVDPLDGTKEFIAKNGEFAVMLGLAVEGKAKVGVVYQPVHDKLYQGIVGDRGTAGGAWLEHRGERRPLQVSNREDTSQLRLVASRSHRPPEIDALAAELGTDDIVQSGSVGLKIGMIAEQRADLYVHPSDRSSQWDCCGPEAIHVGARGVFTDVTGAPYLYGGEDMRNRRGITACNTAAWEKVKPSVLAIAAQLGWFGEKN